MNEIILQGIEFISSAAYGGLVWDSIKQVFGVENGKKLELAGKDSAEKLKNQLEAQLEYDEALQQKLQAWLEKCNEFQQWKATGQGSRNTTVHGNNTGTINSGNQQGVNNPQGDNTIGIVGDVHGDINFNVPSGEKATKKF